MEAANTVGIRAEIHGVEVKCMANNEAAVIFESGRMIVSRVGRVFNLLAHCTNHPN